MEDKKFRQEDDSFRNLVYRRIMIRSVDKVANEEVINRMGEKKFVAYPD